MPPKTMTEAKKMIADLKAIKPTVRRQNVFGDNHHDAIDAQLDVLEKALGEDEIYDAFGRTDNVRDGALEALAWRNGEKMEFGLLESWQELSQIEETQ